jgi:hypothetical protein
MADDQLAELFANGTAPEHDAAFARRIDARIASARRGLRLRAIAARVLVILTLAATAFVTIRALEPALQQIAESSPQFMGVPLPLVLGALAVGLAVRFRRFVRLGLG